MPGRTRCRAGTVHGVARVGDDSGGAVHVLLQPLDIGGTS
jgi:hypothetical protein